MQNVRWRSKDDPTPPHQNVHQRVKRKENEWDKSAEQRLWGNLKNETKLSVGQGQKVVAREQPSSSGQNLTRRRKSQA